MGLILHRAAPAVTCRKEKPAPAVTRRKCTLSIDFQYEQHSLT